MSKGINKILDFMKLNEEDDDFENEYYDEEIEEEEGGAIKSFFSRNKEKEEFSERPEPVSATTFEDRKRAKAASSKGKLVALNGGRGTEIAVVKPQEFNKAQEVADALKEGKTIVINMEGIEIYVAQRIIDFISGACYALNGTLQAISSNIFIAAPESIDVSGDLREELLSESVLSPEIGKYRV